MIKVENGNFKCSGNIVTLQTDLSIVIKGVYATFEEKGIDKSFVGDAISVGKMTDEEVAEMLKNQTKITETAEKFKDFMESLFDALEGKTHEKPTE